MLKFVIYFLVVCTLHIEVESAWGGRYAVGIVQTRPKNTSQSTKDYCDNMDCLLDDDLIVYPEGTLNDPNTACLVPHPMEKVTPYKNETYNKYEPMRAISQAAAEHNVYAVINLYERANCTNPKTCPSRGYFLYSTNVVFDRMGMVIARYRKYNLNGENHIDSPDTVELSTFTTEFNITFGMFTGWDILFKSPAIDLVKEKRVKNFIFPNSWKGELPFLTGVQLQCGWSYALNVNLLAPSVNKPSMGYSGSGVYKSRAYSFTCMNDRDLDLVILARLTVNESRIVDTYSTEQRNLNLAKDPTITSAEGKTLNPVLGVFQDRICHNGLCCFFTARYEESQYPNVYNYTYRAVTYRGKRKFGANITKDVEYCGVVLCTNGDCARMPPDGLYPIVFHDMKIEGEFRGGGGLQMPSALTWDDLDGEQCLVVTPYYFTFDSRVENGTSSAFIEGTELVDTQVTTFGIYSFSYL